MSGMARLRVAQGRSTADEFEVTGEITIGRAAECDVRVFDEGASRRHAIVRREGDQYFAIDQGSTNGTYVNGRRVERQALKTGDEVSVRNLTLVFMDDGAVASALIYRRTHGITTQLLPVTCVTAFLDVSPKRMIKPYPHPTPNII